MSDLNTKKLFAVLSARDRNIKNFYETHSTEVMDKEKVLQETHRNLLENQKLARILDKDLKAKEEALQKSLQAAQKMQELAKSLDTQLQAKGLALSKATATAHDAQKAAKRLDTDLKAKDEALHQAHQAAHEAQNLADQLSQRVEKQSYGLTLVRQNVLKLREIIFEKEREEQGWLRHITETEKYYRLAFAAANPFIYIFLRPFLRSFLHRSRLPGSRPPRPLPEMNLSALTAELENPGSPSTPPQDLPEATRSAEGKKPSVLQSDSRLIHDLEAKERVIQDLLLERRAWRTAAFPFWPAQRITLWILKKKKIYTQVRLGELSQHKPRPFQFHFRICSKSAGGLPTISLVTPSYNQGRFLRACLPGVLFQGYPRLEYVVQDGGSSDESREVILEHAAGLHAWVSEPDGGQARAINLGFQKTSGEIMGWLNADDLHVPNTLWQVGEFFRNHPQVDVVYGHRLIINEDGHLVGSWIMPSHEDEVLSWADYIPQETLFWRRSVWEKAGGRLDEGFHFALDWDLILRFRSAGARFHRIPKVLGCFRVHGNQKTSRELGDRGRREMDLLRARIHGKFPSDEEIWNQIKTHLRKSVYSNNLWDLENRWKRAVYRKKRGTIFL